MTKGIPEDIFQELVVSLIVELYKWEAYDSLYHAHNKTSLIYDSSSWTLVGDDDNGYFFCHQELSKEQSEKIKDVLIIREMELERLKKEEKMDLMKSFLRRQQ